MSTDARLRALERAASTGDPEATARLAAERARLEPPAREPGTCRVADALLTVEDTAQTRYDNRPVFQWSVELGSGESWSEDDLCGPASGREPGLDEMLSTLLSFLGAAAETYQGRMRRGEEQPDEGELFPTALCAWAAEHSDELSMAQSELEHETWAGELRDERERIANALESLRDVDARDCRGPHCGHNPTGFGWHHEWCPTEDIGSCPFGGRLEVRLLAGHRGDWELATGDASCDPPHRCQEAVGSGEVTGSETDADLEELASELIEAAIAARWAS